MSNIIKIEKIPALKPAETIALEAHFKPKVKELKKSDMIRPLVASIAKARQIKGHSASIKDDELCADIVITELKSTFTTYSIEEICIAIDLGAKGLLDVENTIHVSAENIFKWIFAYNQKIRQEAIAKMKAFNESEEKRISEEEKIKKHNNFLKEIELSYSVFCDTDELSSIEGLKAAYYRELKKQNKIDLSNEVRNGIYYEMKSYYERVISKQESNKTFQDKLNERLYGKHDYEKEIIEKCEAKGLEVQFNEWRAKKYKLILI